ncbi:vWA domain-containing protein [Agarivorans aestuarii]|uniref:vWA domain-containing protein n=1 Tax=Agarivorans aestuarii TaxID=1563703 RepID=UPI001C820CCC|nr:VWA domain-containing protein [Agarivorans aestuarii]
MIDYLASLVSDDISNFHFLRPWWLVAILPILAFYSILRKEDDLTTQWRKHMSPKMVKQLTVNTQSHAHLTPRKLFLVVALIATLVMAGPSWTRQSSPLFEDKSELIIALDVAESMYSTDLQPTRLTRAKQKVVKLIERRGDAKTALVIYGGSAHVAMPATKDSTLARYFLDVFDLQLLPDQTTAPDAFIQPARRLLEKTEVPSTVLLLTDKTDEQAIQRMQQEFADLQHQVVVWAIGEHPESGAGAPQLGIGLGEVELGHLADLAKAGHGEMVRFTHDNSDVEQVYRFIKNNLFSSNDAEQPWLDAGYWLLFILLPLQLMWFRRGWTLKW